MLTKKTSIILGLSVVAFLSFSSCGGSFKKSDVDSAAIKEALDKAMKKDDNTREVTIESGGYSLNIPKHMQVASGLNNDASLQYQNTSKELYIIVIDESKTDFIKKFADDALNPYDDDLTPEKNYRIIQMASMEESIVAKAKPAVKKTTINGLDAEIVDLTGTVEGIDSDIFYKFAFIEGTKKLYMVMTWTLDSEKNENMDDMDAMLQSFKLAE